MDTGWTVKAVYCEAKPLFLLFMFVILRARFSRFCLIVSFVLPQSYQKAERGQREKR